MNILRAAQSLFGRRPKVYASEGTAGVSGFRWWLPGARYDYRTEAGDSWESSVPSICLNWLNRTWPEPRWCAKRKVRDGSEVRFEEVEHPAVAAIENPNRWYDESVLWAGTLLSYHLDGNAYWLKLRDRLGSVAGFVYVPHFQMRPMADKYNPGGRELVTYYEYTPIGGTPEPVPLEEVVHFRCGIDPRDVRKGLSPLAAQLREVCSDNEAGTFSAALLRNMGVPSVILAPKPAGQGMGPPNVTPEQKDMLRAQWRQRLSSEGAGSPFVAPFPMDALPLGLSPEQLALDKVRRMPADRICAAFGLSTLIVGLPSESKTYSNYAEARESAFEDCVIPLRRTFGKQFTQQVIRRDYPGDDAHLMSDYSEIRVLQEDRDKLFKRTADVYKAGVVDRAKAKELIGMTPDGADVGVYATDFAGRQISDRAEDEKQATKAGIVAQLIELGVDAEAAARAVGFDRELAGQLARRDWEV